MLAVTSAQAATSTTTFDVTATIIASCTIAATNLTFGNYDPLSATDLDATSTISVTCSNAAPYDVRLNGGASGSTAARTMLNGANTLNYQMYSDSGRTTVWGNTAPTGVSGTGIGSNQDITVYGRVANGQTTPPVGAYMDTITATITY